MIDELAAGQAANAWTQLHPAQQQLISQNNYVACRAQSGTLPLRSVRLVSSHRERITVPGTKVTAVSLALVVKVTLTNGQTSTFTTHAVKVGGAWRYTLIGTEVTRCEGTRTPSS